MKKFSKLMLGAAAVKVMVVGAMVLFSANASAQKFATINTSELIAVMPELDSVNSKLQAYQRELVAQMEEIQVEYNKKVEDFSAKGESMTTSVRQLKEKELNDLRTRFLEFQETAQEDMAEKQGELMAPVIARAREAIQKVSKDGGYLIVFDSSAASTVYVDEVQVVNILPMVKKALGIPENAKPKQPQAPAN